MTDEVAGDESVLGAARSWSFNRPKTRWLMRETWGLARAFAHRLHLPPPFDPAEFHDLASTRLERAGNVDPDRKPRVLFLSFRGWSTHLLWETTFARAVAQSGGDPVFATCGGRLPVCDVMTVHTGAPMPCLSCGGYAEDSLRSAGFKPYRVKDLADLPALRKAAQERVHHLKSVRECERFVDGDLELGRLVRISVAWFLARGTLPEQGDVIDVYRRFLVSGLILSRAFDELLNIVRPDRVFTINGAFFAERILIHLARQRGIGTMAYERAFMADSLLFTNRLSCDMEVEPEFWEESRAHPLTDAQAQELDDYIGARFRGLHTADAPDNAIEGWDEICRDLSLDPARPKVIMFTNVVWDSAVQEREWAFPGMNEWVCETIEGFAKMPEVDLIVRIHPGELSGNHKTEERMREVISGRFSTLPENVRVIAPTDAISSYTLMAAGRFGLVYASTVGLELALTGKPVVVAARTHYRDRGFTHDPDNPQTYWTTIKDLLRVLPDAEQLAASRELARRYAYLFFFRYMQRVAQVAENGNSRPRLTYRSSADLRPGIDPTLDRIVTGIVEGRPIMAPL